ncbi:MAG: PP2C family protein-serine/threonine phosphatase [Bryobacteraceae bacterium]
MASTSAGDGSRDAAGPYHAYMERMQCMEVWGGSQMTERSVAFGGLETWVYSRPYAGAEHGGDVYYASSCATGRISRLLLADVAGHGDAVAKTAAGLRSLMRKFVNRLDQAEFVRLLNQQFAAESEVGVFATSVVTTFFAPSRRMMICNAGHPRPILYRHSGQEWTVLDGRGEDTPAGPANLPLGLLSMTQYEHFDIELAPGDCLLMYTDALIESEGADGEMIGEEGVLEVVRATSAEVAPRDGSAFVKRLLERIASLYEGNFESDDVTVMLLRATGGDGSYSLGEKLEAAARVARSVFSSEPVPFPDFSVPNVGGALLSTLGKRWRAKTH